jgi:hypothetical protein
LENPVGTGLSRDSSNNKSGIPMNRAIGMPAGKFDFAFIF